MCCWPLDTASSLCTMLTCATTPFLAQLRFLAVTDQHSRHQQQQCHTLSSYYRRDRAICRTSLGFCMAYQVVDGTTAHTLITPLALCAVPRAPVLVLVRARQGVPGARRQCRLPAVPGHPQGKRHDRRVGKAEGFVSSSHLTHVLEPTATSNHAYSTHQESYSSIG